MTDPGTRRPGHRPRGGDLGTPVDDDAVRDGATAPGPDPVEVGRRPRAPAPSLRAMLASPRGLRHAMLAAEVLGPPVAARRRGARRR